jgi:putative transposase
MIVPGTLGREGIRFKGLRWNSNDFSALRNRIGTNADVQVRIDPLDLRHAYAYDPEKRRWVEGDLLTADCDEGLTLHQYEVIRKHARATQQPTEDQMAALARARGEIFDFVQEIIKQNRKSKAGKRFARFYADGRKPAEHIAKATIDLEKSASALGSHPIKLPIESTPLPIPPSGSDIEIEPLPVRRRRI